MNMQKLMTVLMGFAAMTLAGTTKADVINFDLTTGNSGISGYSGPFAQVTVNLVNSTTADITFSSLSANGNTYLIGSQTAVGVNVNATSWTLGSLTGATTGTGFSGPSLSNGGSAGMDGFGTFNQTITEFDGFSYSLGTISFVLNNTSGAWASASGVLDANSNGNTAAAHIFVTSSPANQANGALATGFAANGTTTDVPDGGSTLVLLGFASLGMVLFVRKTQTA